MIICGLFDFSLERKNLDLKYKLRVWHNSPSWKTPCPISIVWWAVNFGNFSQTHSYHAFIPSFYDLAEPNRKCERFLSRIFGAPELLGEVVILSVPSAVDCDALTSTRERSIACSNERFREAHDFNPVFPLIWLDMAHHQLLAWWHRATKSSKSRTIPVLTYTGLNAQPRDLIRISIRVYRLYALSLVVPPLDSEWGC